MVAGGDTETGDEVVDDTPDKGLSVELGGEHAVDGKSRSDSNGQKRDPLDVPEQVLPRHWREELLLLNVV